MVVRMCDGKRGERMVRKQILPVEFTYAVAYA